MLGEIKAPITNKIIWFIVLYHVFLMVVGRSVGITEETYIQYGAYSREHILNGEFFRLFTVAFTHGGFTHLFFNSIGFFFLGKIIEPQMSRMKYIILLISTTLLSSLSVLYFSETELAVGASGTLFALLGCAVYLSLHKKHLIFYGLRKEIVIMTLLNILISFAIPFISASAHMSGLITGYLLAFFFIKEGKLEIYEEPQENEAEILDEMIDNKREEFEERRDSLEKRKEEVREMVVNVYKQSNKEYLEDYEKRNKNKVNNVSVKATAFFMSLDGKAEEEHDENVLEITEDMLGKTIKISGNKGRIKFSGDGVNRYNISIRTEDNIRYLLVTRIEEDKDE